MYTVTKYAVLGKGPAGTVDKGGLAGVGDQATRDAVVLQVVEALGDVEEVDLRDLWVDLARGKQVVHLDDVVAGARNAIRREGT